MIALNIQGIKEARKVYVAIDNGVTGAIAMMDELGDLLYLGLTPVRKVMDYTKARNLINRLDGVAFKEILEPLIPSKTVIRLERPAASPKLNWKNTVSAIRCDEAQQIVMEGLGLPFQHIDSRDWQTSMLKMPKKKKVVPVTKHLKAKLSKEELAAVVAENKAAKSYNSRISGQTKKQALAMADQLFPFAIQGTVEKRKALADAALIALWMRSSKV